MKIQKEKITVLFGSWINLSNNSINIEDYIDVKNEDLVYLDELFIGLHPGDRFNPFYSYLKSISSENKYKVLITSIPDFTDIIKGFCDFNKISYKFVFFNVNKNKIELEDLGEKISKIFREANKEWQTSVKTFYPEEGIN